MSVKLYLVAVSRDVSANVSADGACILILKGIPAIRGHGCHGRLHGNNPGNNILQINRCTSPPPCIHIAKR
jgi:hypothetical protein